MYGLTWIKDKVDSEKYEITDYKEICGNELKIPEDIKEVKIKKIGNNAFSKKGLTTVVMPRTVTTIGNNVFDNNTGLESITINGKSNSSEFDKLGTNWNGTCTNIIYSK